MTLRAILLCFFITGLLQQARAIRATTARTLFYKANKQDSSKYDANILLGWRVQNASLHFTRNEALAYEAEFICMIRISNDTGIFKEETYVVKTPAKATPAEAFDQINADQYEYLLPAARYQLEMVLFEEAYKDKLYEYKDTFTVRPVSDSTAFLSGIHLLDTSFRTNAKTIYSRNGFLDLPLASNYLNEKRDSVLFYYEVYEASKMKQDLGPLKVSSYISWKPFSSPVPKFEHTDTADLSARKQHFHVSFPLEQLTSGNYYLNIVLSDKHDLVIDKKSLFLQRFNNREIKPVQESPLSDTARKDADTTVAKVLDLTNTFVGKYNAGQVRAILKMMLLVCDKVEGNSINGFLRKPDELYSKYFIYNFWEKRDKQNPGKAWKAYADRIKEVNKLFNGGVKPGYETDRGRIYIQYGKPNDRIIVNNETGALPYEIWQYYNTEKQGREGVFLFYKPGKSLGDYELLHATLVGEKRNGNWRSLLYNNSITGSGGINTDSRAEQYIGNK